MSVLMCYAIQSIFPASQPVFPVQALELSDEDETIIEYRFMYGWMKITLYLLC